MLQSGTKGVCLSSASARADDGDRRSENAAQKDVLEKHLSSRIPVEFSRSSSLSDAGYNKDEHDTIDFHRNQRLREVNQGAGDGCEDAGEAVDGRPNGRTNGRPDGRPDGRGSGARTETHSGEQNERWKSLVAILSKLDWRMRCPWLDPSTTVSTTTATTSTSSGRIRGPPMCGMCRQVIARSELIQKLRCHHEFHSTCLAPWFQRRTKCPTCGRNIFSQT